MKITQARLLELKAYAGRAHTGVLADRRKGITTRNERLIGEMCDEARALLDFFDALVRESEEAEIVLDVRIGVIQD